MRNRHGVKYDFVEVSESTYQFVMDEEEMKYCRFGGLEGQDRLDYSNLGFFDPSGGPFVGLGGKIDGKRISRIFVEDFKVFMDVV